MICPGRTLTVKGVGSGDLVNKPIQGESKETKFEEASRTNSALTRHGTNDAYETGGSINLHEIPIPQHL